MTSVDRLPPSNLEAEQGILGCVIMSPKECMPVCQESLAAGKDVFYDLRNQTIYEAFVQMDSENKPIDTVTVVDHLNKASLLDDAGGFEYIATLPDAVPSTANLTYYVGIVMERFVSRQVIQVCTEMIGQAYEFIDKPNELLDELEQRVLKIRPNIKTGSKTIRSLVSESMEKIEEQYRNAGSLPGISTGLSDLDRKTGGLHKGEETVIAGYPGSGKTSLAMNIASHIAIKSSLNTLVFSMEMSAQSLVTRIICAEASVNLREVRRGERGGIRDSDFINLRNAAARVATSHITIEDDSDLSIYQLRAKARRHAQKERIDLIVVDYLQLLSAIGGYRKVESRQQEVADISKGIKALAREFNVPVIALSQLNDDGKLRESRSIGQDTDNIWVLTPSSKEDEIVPVDIEISKARNGPVGHVPVVFLKKFTRFVSAVKDTGKNP